jgi:two-component system NtrC family sensor kinase
MPQRPKPSQPKAKLPVARKSPQSDSVKLRDLEKRLAEALDQQTATSEILRVISSSPTDVQPVFEVVAANVARLCDAFDATIFRVDGDVLRLVAHRGPIAPDPILPLTEGMLGGRVIRERRAVHVDDMQAETREYPMSSEFARNREFRTILSVPLLRGPEAIGLIAIRRTEVRPFTDNQIALLQTFADQAVIAIENVRLFTELQEKNTALTAAHAQVSEALEQQTATSEILRVISGSPTDVQPVFDNIGRSAVRLCEARFAAVYRYDGDVLDLASHYNFTPEAVREIRSAFPTRELGGTSVGRAIRERRVVHIEDFDSDKLVPLFSQRVARALGYRSMLVVPMLRDEQAVGALVVGHVEARAFDQRHVELLQTFADQAVIAIENVRLFNETKEALERQTATSEILRAISSSPTDLQPVLNTIAINAVRVCGAYDATLLLREGEFVCRAAHHGPLTSGREDLVPINRSFVSNRTILESKPVHLQDVLAPEGSDFSDSRESAQRVGFRTILSVPCSTRAALSAH